LLITSARAHFLTVINGSGIYLCQINLRQHYNKSLLGEIDCFSLPVAAGVASSAPPANPKRLRGISENEV
jgi:hypothetical protein